MLNYRKPKLLKPPADFSHEDGNVEHCITQIRVRWSDLT